MSLRKVNKKLNKNKQNLARYRLNILKVGKSNLLKKNVFKNQIVREQYST